MLDRYLIAIRWRGLIAFIIIVLSIIFDPSIAWAEGSITLNPSGATGYRHYLVDTTSFSPGGINAQTTFFVYVNAGETINLASSALALGSGRIIYTKPSGTSITVSTNPGNSTVCPTQQGGYIGTRNQEIAGPNGTGGYTPCTITVGGSEGGLWQVKFSSPDPSEAV